MSADSLAMFVCDDLVELKAWPLSSLKPHQYEEGFGCFLVWVDQSWRSSGVWHWSPVITEMPQCHNGWNGVSWLTFSQILHSPKAPFSLGHTTNSLVHNVLLPVLLHRHLGDSLEWPGPVPSWMDVFLCFGSVLTLYVYIYGLCSLGSVGGGNPLYCPGSLPLSPSDLGTSCGHSAPATEPFPTCWQTFAWSLFNILSGWTFKGH